MQFMRGLMRWPSSIFLHSTLLLFILSFAFVSLFTNKDTVKEILVESEVYNQFVPALIADNVKASEGKRTALPFDDPEIQSIAANSFTPQSLKQETEKVIDQAFSWLNEESTELKFSVDLNQQKDSFVDGVGTYAANRLGGLPTCDTVDLGQITVFELACRPEGVPLTFIKERVVADLLASDFLQDVQISEQDLPRTQDGKLLPERYSFVPRVYQLARKGIWISSVLFLIALAAFVFVRRPYRKGFRALGRDLFSSAATFMLMTFIFGFILPRYTNSFNIQGGETMKLFNSVLDVFVKRFDIILINVSLQIFAVAIIIVALERMSRPATLYGGIAKKAGMSSSVGRKKISEMSNKQPPIQTSEVKKKAKMRKKGLSKYRKMGL